MIRFFSRFNINNAFLAAAIFVFNHNNINSMEIRVTVPEKKEYIGHCEIPGCYCARSEKECNIQILTPGSFCTRAVRHMCLLNTASFSLCMCVCCKFLKKCCRSKR